MTCLCSSSDSAIVRPVGHTLLGSSLIFTNLLRGPVSARAARTWDSGAVKPVRIRTDHPFHAPNLLATRPPGCPSHPSERGHVVHNVPFTSCVSDFVDISDRQ